MFHLLWIAMGAQIHIPLHGEPNSQTILRGPEDVAGQRAARYAGRPICPGADGPGRGIERLWGSGIHVGPNTGAQGPVTIAVLLAGMDLPAWSCKAPEAAHRLLDFCARSAPRFLRKTNRRYGGYWPPVRWGLADDFAGMFAPALSDEYVSPYWDRYFIEIGC
ncbi:MAG: hypothetical protein IT210_11430 [Armatimonadetes bacterium]|nr:hypothetical protein [Armatimonadota bacterium]